MPAVCGPTAALQRLEVDVAVRLRRDFLDRAAAHRRGRRVRAVRGIGHDDLDAREILAGLVVRANHRHAGKLALRARHRRQRHAAHAGHFLQHLLQFEQDLQDALPCRFRRERMPVEQLGQHRVLVTRLRVVLHRARPERVEVRVDGEVELRQAREVTHRLQFRHLGQQRRAGTAQRCRNRRLDGHLRVLRVGAAAGRGVLEYQLFMHGFACPGLRPRRGSCASPSASACA